MAGDKAESEKEPLSKRDKEIAILKARRTVCEQQITRAHDFVDKIQNSTTISTSELAIRLKALETAFDTFSSVQAKIEEKDNDEISEPNRAEYEEMYYLTAAAFKVAIQRLDKGTHPLDETIEQDKYSAIRLPKIELHSFSGEVTEWLSWHDKFVSLVHENQHLNTLAKFHHLVSKLEGTAAATIDGLKIVSENYEIALHRLRERFENKKVIGRKYIELIFDHPKITKPCVKDLQGIIDKMNNYLTGLKNLNRPVDQWDDLMVHIITSKLDQPTLIKWKEESSTDRMATLSELMQFLRKRCQILDDNTSSNSSENCFKNHSNYNKTNKQSKAFTVTQKLCNFCHKPGHFIYRCVAFINLSAAMRLQRVQLLKLCENCLKSGNHNANECKSEFRCHMCKAKHHSLLHQPNNDAVSSNLSLQNAANSSSSSPPHIYDSQRSYNAASTIALHNKGTEGNILGTVIVEIVNSLNQTIPCRALLDSGSQLNMVSEKIAKIAGLKRRQSHIQFSGANNMQSYSKYKTIVVIKSKYNEFRITLEASIMPQITGMLPDTKFDISNWNIPSNIKLSDPSFNIPQRIDLLIGIDAFYDIMSVGQIRLGNNLPIAQNTLFGWIIAGKMAVPETSTLRCHALQNVHVTDSESSLDKSIQAFWQCENFDYIKPRSTNEEVECEKHFCSNVCRSKDGRYQVRLPFKVSPDKLGGSYEIALKRFYMLERKFRRNEQLHQHYKQFMQEFISLSHMELVIKPDFTQPHYVIPHHCVLKPSSSTTKLRVVFDASSKTTNGNSLNELLMVGPVIQQDLFSITLRFRYHKYVFTADITKMYRQISLHPDDRRYHYIVWRDSEDESIKLYQLSTVTYGTASASFLATRALQQLTIDEQQIFPLAAHTANMDVYVDDLLTGANDLGNAVTLQKQLQAMLSKGGFELRKWCANHSELLKNIPDSDREKSCLINGKDAIKALGIFWNPSTDKFIYYNMISESKTTITKRNVLSEISQFFDPLGLINPIIVSAKIFMQQLWRLKLHWDAALPQEYYSRWSTFKKQLNHLVDFEIERRVFADNAHYELHAFSDSSELAYGACLYVRSIAKDGSVLDVKLLCAKSRVAPLKRLSLPKLELCAAVIMIQLVKRIKAIFDHVQFQNITYWTDSTVVLCWISNESCEWQTFVANRVSLIQEFSTSSQWRHVPSELNPADLLSRGVLPADLLNCSMWYTGPEFLIKSEAHWPMMPMNIVHDNNLLNRKKMKIVLTNQDNMFIENIKYHNNYNKLIRVIAYMLRFKYNSMQKSKENRYAGWLCASETQRALFTIVKIIQRCEFATEIAAIKNKTSLPKGSHIRSLIPFIDDDGILRVGGRLQHSAIEYNSKHPILLPKGHIFTRCLLIYHHNVNNHVGPQALLCIVRQLFWPIHGKTMARSIVHNCVRCSRANPFKRDQLMADLPEMRVQQARPFNIVGIDFCGPFFVHFRRRGASPVKAYVAVFVCFVTKAIHLELVEDLSTKAFLLCLKRFIGRRGRCSVIYTDNATNFTGARNELRELYQTFHKNATEIEKACTDDGITWKNIPPRSPHFGGLWEAAVKSFKFHFKRILKSSSLTFSELNTLIIQIESILNSRPITPVPENPNDPPAITPGHFIIGTALKTFPEPDIKHISNVNRLQRYQQLQWYFQQFWDRWHKDYLQSLQIRTKWTLPGTIIRVGDVVIVQEENLQPLQWKLGRVTRVHPGKDGVIRVVTLKTSNGQIQRATNKIRRLPIE